MSVQTGALLVVTVDSPTINTVQISDEGAGKYQAAWNGGSVHSFAGVEAFYVVTKGATNNQVAITLVTGKRNVIGGALYNRFAFNPMAFNILESSFTPIAPLPNAQVFKEAMDSGALQVPFQYDFTVAV